MSMTSERKYRPEEGDGGALLDTNVLDRTMTKTLLLVLDDGYYCTM